VTIYSIMPDEQIFAGMDEMQDPVEEINLHGMIMQVQPINERQARIVRLISPNPQDYLNPAYAPGEVIHYQPSLTS
jgi:hypothetical protein